MWRAVNEVAVLDSVSETWLADIFLTWHFLGLFFVELHYPRIPVLSWNSWRYC